MGDFPNVSEAEEDMIKQKQTWDWAMNECLLLLDRTTNDSFGCNGSPLSPEYSFSRSSTLPATTMGPPSICVMPRSDVPVL